MGRHKAQSICAWLGAALSVPSTATSLTMPPLVHTSSVALGAAKEDAMATPKDKANHTSTKRVRWRSCLKVFMACILSKELGQPKSAGRLAFNAATPSRTSGPAKPMNSSASEVSNAGPAWRSQLFKEYLVQRMALWLPLANLSATS